MAAKTQEKTIKRLKSLEDKFEKLMSVVEESNSRLQGLEDSVTPVMDIINERIVQVQKGQITQTTAQNPGALRTISAGAQPDKLDRILKLLPGVMGQEPTLAEQFMFNMASAQTNFMNAITARIAGKEVEKAIVEVTK